MLDPATTQTDSHPAATASAYPAKLVWLLSFLALYTTVIMVVIVWWTLVDVRSEREKIDGAKSELKAAHSLLDSRLEKERWAITALLEGEEGQPPGAQGEDIPALVAELGRVIQARRDDPLFQQLEKETANLLGLRARCRSWAEDHAQVLAGFPAARQRVETALREMEVAVTRVAAARMRRWAAAIGSGAKDAGDLTGEMMALADLTPVVGELQEIALAYTTLVGESDTVQLGILKDQRLRPVLARLLQRAPRFPVIPGEVDPRPLPRRITAALFGDGFRLEKERLIPDNDGDHLFGLCLRRARQLNKRDALRLELLSRSEAIHNTVARLVEKAEEEIQRQAATAESAIRRALQIILIVGTATAVIFLAISYRVVREIRGQIKAIEETNIALDNRTRALTKSEEALRRSERQLQYLSSNLLTAQEKERRRIAHELHDELGQAMAALKMQVGAVERRLSQAGENAISEECNGIRRFIDEIIENVRRLSKDLSPVVIDDLGLEAAIDYLATNFSKLHHTPVTLDLTDIDPFFSREAQRLIYRVIQEALTNISKHAEAKQVYIAARPENHDITFVIQDDGRGFDVEATLDRRATERGMGLATMAERVRIIGGTLQFHSEPGHGTTVVFTVPVHRARPAAATS